MLGANVGLVIAIGLLIAIPTWYVTSYLFGLWAGKRWVLPVPELLGTADDEDVTDPPSFRTVLLVLLLPLVLIFLNTGLDLAAAAGRVNRDDTWVASSARARYHSDRTVDRRSGGRLRPRTSARPGQDRAGEDPRLGARTGLLGHPDHRRRRDVRRGAPGLGYRRCAGRCAGDIGLPVIVAGFIIALVLRVAQGSATVALITAAGLIEPAVASAGLNGVELAAVVLAVAAGSVCLSHVNDSGFWLVGRFFGMDVKTTLKTWTVMETTIGLMGFALASLVFVIA